MQILLYRRVNAPFLSGDSFARLADYHVFGKKGNKAINLKKLRKAKVIFVSGHLLARLLDNHFADIYAKVLICGNSDENFEEPIVFPQSINLWLCQNNSMSNTKEKITIPIGLENMRLARAGLPKSFKSYNSNEIQNKVLMPPMWPTNPNRFLAVSEALERKDLFDVYRDYIPNSQYVGFFGRYKFVFCCEGNGFENHRVWESLYRNSFPVMLNTPWAKTLIDLNLPILYVDKISDLNTKMLEDHLDKWRNFDPKNCPSLWLPYWKKLILSARDERH